MTDLKETAALARLRMSEQELQSMFPAFEEMISFFDVMQDADRDETAFTAPINTRAEGMDAFSRHVNAAYLRPDSENPGNPGLCEEMLTKAGERDGRFIVIPNVL